MRTCLVIGAGMAGLSAAKVLIDAGWQVIVLDKGRGVGGRMATRRIEDAKFDHGAQFFSAKSTELKQFVNHLLETKIAQTWHLEESDAKFHHSRYCGSQGMNQIPKFMADKILVHTNEKVLKLDVNAGIARATCESGNEFTADAVICTIPAPQALELVNNSSLKLQEDTLHTLDKIRYYPCLAVMVVLNQPTNIPNPGGMSFNNHSFSWIADNYKKGISPKFSAVIHASPEFSLQHLESDLSIIGQQLLEEASEWIIPSSIENFQVHRWRYSLAEIRYTEHFIKDTMVDIPLYFAGDGFGNGNIEGAFLSGMYAAQSLSSN